jgi:hypothetical protein
VANRAIPRKQLSPPFLGRETKYALYKTFITPILTYGSESWPLKRKDGNMFRIFEEEYYKGFMVQLRKMVYREQGITMDFITCIMSQTQ